MKYEINGIKFDNLQDAELYVMDNYEDQYRNAEELCELCERLISME